MMSRQSRSLVILIPLAAVILVLTVGGAFAARKGNIAYEVNYNGVLDGQVRVCDQSANMPDNALAWGIQQWNEAIGKTILVLDCGGTRGITVVDEPVGGQCGGDAPACARYPLIQDRTELFMYVTPLVPTYTTDQQKTIAVHELGHNLGFDHWTAACGQSIMETGPCNPYEFVEPQPVDEQNYYTAYHVDAVVNFGGTPAGPGVVNFTWNPSAIHNEREFTIWRNPSAWDWVGSTGKDGSSLTAGDQTPGPQTYGLWPNTQALPEYWGDHVEIQVNVQGAATPTPTPPPLSPPAWIKSQITSATNDKLSWAAVSGAHHYKICNDLSPSGSFGNCLDLTQTYYYTTMPGPESDGVQWYHKARACDASNNCSALSSDWTLTERASFVGWNYTFTYYRDGSNIKFQFINLSWVPLRIYIKNGSSCSSPNVTYTEYVDFEEISDVKSAARSSFTSGKLGTRARASSGYAPSCRWGYCNYP